MVMAVRKYLNPTQLIIPNKFCFKNFAQKSIPGGVLALGLFPGDVLALVLLLGVFGSGLGPDGPGCPEIP